ncbi:MAG: PIG-L family deacetylase [Acidimicrobiales bacterium]|nr:PIG-L family deacetylase [Acidimicrobiales bacterium]
MLSLLPAPTDEPLRVLCLGAHADDIEIGAGATLLRLQAERPVVAKAVVFSATADRTAEQERASAMLFEKADGYELDIHGFRENLFPDQWAAIKSVLHESSAFAPDVVFTHRREDRHQDHATVADLTWNAFRDHLVLQYEIPKYEGDLGSPNAYVPVDDAVIERKVEIIRTAFASQADKAWFDADTFKGLARIRGVECNQRWAEAFHSTKFIL